MLPDYKVMLPDYKAIKTFVKTDPLLINYMYYGFLEPNTSYLSTKIQLNRNKKKSAVIINRHCLA